MKQSTFLNVAMLDDQPLRFAFGICSSHGKDGNRLLAKLGQIFEQEYLIRQGKLASIGKTRKRVFIDYRDFPVDELKEAFIVFASLSETFKKTDKPSSALFRKIAMLCVTAQEAQAAPIGLA